MPFHKSTTLYRPGDLVHPGSWGRIISAYGAAHGQFIRETLFEHIRATEFAHRPSRWSCGFAFEDEAFARTWDRGLAELVYPVELVNGSASFRADIGLLDGSGLTRDAWIAAIRRYWVGEIVNPARVEMLVVGDMRVIGLGA
jgi:hypothetical protein